METPESKHLAQVKLVIQSYSMPRPSSSYLSASKNHYVHSLVLNSLFCFLFPLLLLAAALVASPIINSTFRFLHLQHSLHPVDCDHIHAVRLYLLIYSLSNYYDCPLTFDFHANR